MKRSRRWLVAAATALPLLCLLAFAARHHFEAPYFDQWGLVEPIAPPRPNVVLIVVDTLRRDHLGCYGYPRDTSPHIDALARAGVRYTNATSQAPWTTPSIGAILTSRYPSALGIVDEHSALPDGAFTLAERLRDAGYRTEAVVSHVFCSARWNFDQGFSRFDDSNARGHGAVTSEAVSRRAIEIIDAAAGQGRPFFLWLHYFDPHFDFVEHGAYRFPGSRDYAGPVVSGMSGAALRQALGANPAAADVAQLVRFYDSEIAFTDRQIGAVLDHLRQRGLFDSALVVFTGDHGEEFFDHGLLGHGKTLFGELVGVPLLVKYPDRRSGVVDTPVASLDILPTILDVAGIPPGPGLEGRSLARTPEQEPARRVFSETDRRSRLRSVRAGRHKLVLNLDSGALALYDLEQDPSEQHDVAALHPEVAASLREELLAWMRDHPLQRAEPALKIPAQDQQRLRALGYLQDRDGD